MRPERKLHICRYAQPEDTVQKREFTKNKPIFTALIFVLIMLCFAGCAKTAGPASSDNHALKTTVCVPPTRTPAPTPSDASYTAWLKTEDFYSTVNIRSEPEVPEDEDNTLFILHDRDQVFCTGKTKTDAESNQWLEVIIDDSIGYVLSDFVVKQAPRSIAEELSTGVDYDSAFTQLVRIEALTPYVLIDLTLADDNNFISNYTSDPSDGALYSDEIALIQHSTGLKLAAAAEKFKQDGYQLVLWDAYRPYSVTVAMYDAINDPKLIADPSKGSKHNRGAAVDVTLYKDGEMVNLPTKDRVMDVSEASRTSYMSTEQRQMMNYLSEVMETCGFITYRNEWWHFNDSDWASYPLMDFPLHLFTKQS